MEEGFLMWSNQYLLSYLLSSKYVLMLMNEVLKFHDNVSHTELNDMLKLLFNLVINETLV